MDMPVNPQNAWMAQFSLAPYATNREALLRAIADTASAAARSDPYGRDPHDPSPPRNWAPYIPEFIAVLYLRLNDDWTIGVNHACFPLDPDGDEDDRRDLAVEVLKAKVDADKDFGHPDLRHLNPYEHGDPNIPHDPDRPFDSGSFADFRFLRQNETFIFLHHPGKAITVSEGALVAFKNGGSDGMPRHQNYSYFNARQVDPQDMDGMGDVAKLIRIENHATKENGTRIEPTERRDYSIDIKFQIEGGAAGRITMIIDPDTGNGAGSEP